MNTGYLQFIGVSFYCIVLQIKMSNISTFHQILQTVEGVVPPTFVNKRVDDLWSASCTFNDVYYVATDHKLQMAKDKVYGQILADSNLQPMLAGSLAKRELVSLGYAIDIHAVVDVAGIQATIKFKSHIRAEQTYQEAFDSIGSMDRFIKSTCAKILNQIKYEDMPIPKPLSEMCNGKCVSSTR